MDGTDNNLSWNCGAEGETDDPQIIALRSRQKRNFMATLMLSQGVPMMLAGDEAGRTQQGNNNAYCQDNEICWIDWANIDRDLHEFATRLIAFRHAHPVFRRPAGSWVGPFMVRTATTSRGSVTLANRRARSRGTDG